jgi:hypothetical protein
MFDLKINKVNDTKKLKIIQGDCVGECRESDYQEACK